jgi:hypothetical protein
MTYQSAWALLVFLALSAGMFEWAACNVGRPPEHAPPCSGDGWAGHPCASQCVTIGVEIDWDAGQWDDAHVVFTAPSRSVEGACK